MINCKKMKKVIIVYLLMIAFKMALEYSYYSYLSNTAEVFKYDFSVIKYVYGLVWITVLYFFIDFEKERASAFFLELKLILEIIPITVIFAMSNESTVYYSLLCLSFLLCEFIVRKLYLKLSSWKIQHIDGIILVSMVSILIGTLIYILYCNGLPSLMAVNIYDVYKLRASDGLKLGKYMGYMLSWISCVFVPILLARYLNAKRYFCAMGIICYQAVIYLYTGMKSYLFSIPLVVIVTMWGRKQNFFVKIWTIFLSITSFICVTVNVSSISYRLYDLFVRRVMFVSANNKFIYYDFFSQNTKMGIAGIFPRWILPVDNPYEKGIGYIISEIYYRNPEMNSNTGFLAEGYMRFGYVGIIAEMLLFAVILKLVDKFQERNDYAFAIGCGVFAVFQLSDGHLIDSLFFGSWMVLVLIMILGSKKLGGMRKE